MATLKDMLMNARCRLITTEPWYGTMASLMKWIRDDQATPTMGVRIVRGGIIECAYNHAYCNAIAQGEDGLERLMAIVMHEIEHVVRLHIARSGGGDRDPRIWNVAADAIVNGKEKNPRIDDLPKGVVFLMEDLDDNISTEEVYDYLAKNNVKIQIDCPMCGGTGKMGDQKQGGGGGQGKDKKQGGGGGQGKQDQDQDQGGQGQGHGCACPMCGGKSRDGNGKVTVKGSWIDDHSIWKQSTVSKDEARQVVKNMAEQAVSRAAGKTPGHVFELLKRLEKPIVNWKYQFRQLMGRKAGGKRVTFARRSRRHNRFGTPGKSSHASIPLTVAVDTSGSMSTRDLEVVFTEIEAMSQRFKITLIQFDHCVQGNPVQYHRGDWRKIKVQGRGGTNFEGLLDWMEQNKCVGQANLILTDGYDRFGPERPYHVLWCIVNKEVKPPWGQYVCVVKN